MCRWPPWCRPSRCRWSSDHRPAQPADQFGQVVDVFVSLRRDLAAARHFFEPAIGDNRRPAEVVTDEAPSLLRAVDELVPGVCDDTDRYAINWIECDHGRLRARLRPMRGLRRGHTAGVVIRGPAFC